MNHSLINLNKLINSNVIKEPSSNVIKPTKPMQKNVSKKLIFKRSLPNINIKKKKLKPLKMQVINKNENKMQENEKSKYLIKTLKRPLKTKNKCFLSL